MDDCPYTFDSWVSCCQKKKSFANMGHIINILTSARLDYGTYREGNKNGHTSVTNLRFT